MKPVQMLPVENRLPRVVAALVAVCCWHRPALERGLNPPRARHDRGVVSTQNGAVALPGVVVSVRDASDRESRPAGVGRRRAFRRRALTPRAITSARRSTVSKRSIATRSFLRLEPSS